MLTNICNALHDVTSSIERMSHQHLIQNDTKTPYITLLTIKVDDECLWRHVGGRTNIVEDLRFWHPNNLTVAEVTDQWPVIVHENIGGL